jgi:Zn-dependent protease
VQRRFSLPESDFLPGNQNEQLEFLKAWAGTSLAFGIFISRGFVFDFNFLLNLLVAALTCGIGFVVHEMAHRIVANHYGAQARFFSNDGALLISILIAFAGIFIAAPGAVWHRALSPEKSGHIAIVGPISNLLLAGLCFLLVWAVPVLGLPGFVLWGALVGYQINAWLGLFNMIPVDPFDGGKVWRWNKVAFGATAAVALLLVFVVSP